MTGTLDPGLRKQLEKAVREARRVGEAGARAALRALAVDGARPHEAMSVDDRALRLSLRAHGRQLGDQRHPQRETQEIERLAHEVAYEHWHRMLFARFLAENGLLIEPESRVAVSLGECAELAREGQGTDGWKVAEAFAAPLLPQIFRPGDPALAVTLAPETRQALEKLVGELPVAVFTASDSLGWTYQFWQTDRKDQVNRSEVKIGADELPAVTQLFTEPYMVRFLLHNTVGAWRAAKLLAERPELARNAAGGAELAAAVRIAPRNGLPGHDFEYLRFVREPKGDADAECPSAPDGPWRPAAGSFARWPRRAADLRVLDPCCGSGHFLVEGLELLVRLRMEEEGLGVEAATRAVLQDNLFGLEIDPRCTQIAAFNLALAAWKLAGRPIDLPPLQIACSGVAPRVPKQEWLRLAGGDQRLEGALDKLHGLFGKAPTLGSLIDPAGLGEDLFQADYETAERFLAQAVAREDVGEEELERAVAAQGMARAAKLLAGEYDLVITNVPYLGRRKQGARLQTFADGNHPDAKKELATMFVSRILGWLGASGVQAVVVPQNWRFLTTYQRLRERLLRGQKWRLVAGLGSGAFETISGEVVNVALTVLSAEKPGDDWCMAGTDVSAPRGETPILAREKAELLLRGGTPVVLALQSDQLLNPGACVLLRPLARVPLLRAISYGHQGIATADYACFGRKFWEFPERGANWEFQQSTVRQTKQMGGREHVLHWEQGEGPLQRSESVRIQGGGAWGRDGVAVSQMGPLPVTRYTGEYFDNNVAVLTVADAEHLPAVWCFCSSTAFAAGVGQVDQKLNVTNANLVKVPFDLPRWQNVATQDYPNGLPEPYSDDPTQWLFHGHPCGSVVWDEDAKWTADGPLRTDASVLQVAVARLLGYRWPAESDPEMRLAVEASEWVGRCEALHGFADTDGIVSLNVAAGELPAADRLRSLLAAAYGEEWSAAKEQELLTAPADGRRPAKTLNEWLRDRFFAEHMKVFHNRPFIWHLWDGRPDGFHALVNCHRLCGPNGEGRRTLEALTYRHLGEWIDRHRAAQAADEEGADARLAAAQDLQGQLERILEGGPPYDIFVRWRPLHEQPIGWEPNLDDGVRLNIRPFISAELQFGGLKDAGILRAKPSIKWGKDRGKEPQALRPKDEFPWFYSCPGQAPETDRTDYRAAPEAEYDDNRWNDIHYTRAAKHAARAKREKGS